MENYAYIVPGGDAAIKEKKNPHIYEGKFGPYSPQEKQKNEKGARRPLLGRARGGGTQKEAEREKGDEFLWGGGGATLFCTSNHSRKDRRLEGRNYSRRPSQLVRPCVETDGWKVPLPFSQETVQRRGEGVI